MFWQWSQIKEEYPELTLKSTSLLKTESVILHESRADDASPSLRTSISSSPSHGAELIECISLLSSTSQREKPGWAQFFSESAGMILKRSVSASVSEKIEMKKFLFDPVRALWTARMEGCIRTTSLLRWHLWHYRNCDLLQRRRSQFPSLWSDGKFGGWVKSQNS